jgi:CheY-like chemotaxis protein
MRDDSATETAFVLAVTGYGAREDIERSLASGFHGHVLKPVDPQMLWELLRRVADALPDE